MTSVIRPATKKDFTQLLELGKRMHDESRFRVLKHTPEKWMGYLNSLIKDRDYLFVAEEDGKIHGFFFGVIREHWSSTDPVAFEMAIYVTPEKRGNGDAFRLLRGFVVWAIELGVRPDMIQAGVSTEIHVERATRFYEAAGFRVIGPMLVYQGLEET